MKTKSPDEQLAGFMAKFTPEVVELAEKVLAKMRSRLPGAMELVYDNYNALVVGFGPSERASEAVFSVVLYPRWVNLFFLEGALLPDPKKVLRGSGHIVRSIQIHDAADLDKPAIKTLMKKALKQADKKIDAKAPRRIVIRAISARQRPRRPVR